MTLAANASTTAPRRRPGPCSVLERTRHVALGEWVRVHQPGQPTRRGQVIDAGETITVIQVLEEHPRPRARPRRRHAHAASVAARSRGARAARPRASTGMARPSTGCRHRWARRFAPSAARRSIPCAGAPAATSSRPASRRIDGMNTLVRGPEAAGVLGPGLPGARSRRAASSRARGRRTASRSPSSSSALGITARETRASSTGSSAAARCERTRPLSRTRRRSDDRAPSRAARWRSPPPSSWRSTAACTCSS